MSVLIVGFDSAWTPTNSGALVGAFLGDNGKWKELGPPIEADFPAAERQILEWQEAVSPTATLVLLDQPTIVRNATGQRPVENIVASPVSRRYGGVQPANSGRTEMFGPDAPVWRFLDRFGGPAAFGDATSGTHVFETYPVLSLIALGWILPDTRPTGRLPKYNPGRKKTFSASDWRHVCTLAASSLGDAGLREMSQWLIRLRDLSVPRKRDQDALDACLCLVVAVRAVLGNDCLVVGDLQTGHILVPYSEALECELRSRCEATHREPARWLRRLQLF